MPVEESQRIHQLESEVASLRKRISELELASHPGAEHWKAVGEASERRLAATLQNTPNVAIQWYDEAGRVQFWNHASETIYGWTAEEARGRTLDHLIYSQEDAAQFISIIREVVRSGMPAQPFESQFRRRDGSHGICLSTVFEIPGDSETPWFVCMDVDVTETRRIDEELRKNEERFRNIIENSVDWIWEVDDKGLFSYLSPQVEEVLGYKPEELLGKRAADTMTDAEFNRVLPILMDAIKAGGQFRGLECVHRHKSGREVVIEANGTAIVDAKGNWIGHRGVDRDITARKHAEQELRARERSLAHQRTILEQIALGSPLPRILESIALFVEAQLCETMASILLVDHDRAILHRPVAPTLGPDYAAIVDGLPVAEGVGCCGTCVSRRVPVVIEDTETDPLWAGFREEGRRFGIRSAWSTPFFSQSGKILGTFAIYGKEPRQPTEAEKRQIEVAASLASIAVERNIAEMELREREERLRRLGDNIPRGAVYQVSSTPENGRRFLYMSAGAEDLFGVAPEAVLRDASVLYQCIHPDDAPAVAATESASLENLTPFEAEFRSIRPDGEVRWISVRSAPTRLANGMIVWDGVAMDQTDRKRAEEELRRSEERYRHVVDNQAEGLVVVDADGRFIFANPAADSIFCAPRGWLVGKQLKEFLDDDGLDIIAENLARRKRGESNVYELEVRVGAGRDQRRRLQISATPQANISGEFTGSFAIFRDITVQRQLEEERRRLEAQLQHSQKLESLGILAGGIAHDFNNLLTALIGHTDLALEDLPEGSTVRDDVLEIQKISRNAADLCRQMLAYSGKGRFVVRPINVPETMKEIAQLLRVSISKKAVLEFDFPGDFPPIEADVAQFRQIVMNLIVNASEALSDRPGRIRFSARCAYCGEEMLSNAILGENLAPGTYALIAVEDTGVGMDAATRERVFDPFFSTKFAGRGLGLAAVLGIVRGHGGAISVTSEPAVGTTFTIILPQRQPGLREEITPIPLHSGWKGKGRILLVDDEDAILKVGTRLLQRLGFEVLTAENGQIALDLIAAGEEFDIAIVDLTMPVMDGKETFREMRRLRANLPVILSSGYSESEVIQQFPETGFDGFLAKPYSIRLLELALRSAIR